MFNRLLLQIYALASVVEKQNQVKKQSFVCSFSLNVASSDHDYVGLRFLLEWTRSTMLQDKSAMEKCNTIT